MQRQIRTKVDAMAIWRIAKRELQKNNYKQRTIKRELY